MENFRSKSTREGGMQMESYYGGGGNASVGPQSMKDLRSYSTSYAYTSSSMEAAPQYNNKEVRIKKSKSRVSSSFASKSWSFNDPELQRKKRVVGYKAYAVEGKMKGSFRKSFRWIKNTCNHVVHGWW
nr:E3 ubiquitin-protein like [Ipomoea batatas]GMC73142.1 E3 ubiquitin-protein like [Ipomoea batatas]GMC76006.1 E3 ubiquitin-protein like [Ipomoea batatas]GMC78110.1 E3 ubiquitin-protein like [Ipomoea batatas]GME14587.1 E3 ubiquitin-protein like [Ipomoea batatas]